MLYFPEFSPPRCLTGSQEAGIAMTRVAFVCFGPSPDELARKLKADEVVMESPPYEPAAFARMLAKIGYATAYAEGALDRLDAPGAVLPAILGELDDIGQWVGRITGPYSKYPGLLHRIALRVDLEQRLLVAEVQLFAMSGAPSYGVVLGKLRSR
ncbi:hypothetical protein ACFLSF_01985 [Candidatus Bipolaricaulota bacterium]